MYVCTCVCCIKKIVHFIEPTPIMVTANVCSNNDILVITVSWQVCNFFYTCVATERLIYV